MLHSGQISCAHRRPELATARRFWLLPSRARAHSEPHDDDRVHSTPISSAPFFGFQLLEQARRLLRSRFSCDLERSLPRVIPRVSIRSTLQKNRDQIHESVLRRIVKGCVARARPALAASPGVDLGASLDQQLRRFHPLTEERRVKRGDADRVARDPVRVRTLVEKQSKGRLLSEVCGELHGGESLVGVGVQEPRILGEKALEAIDVPDGGRVVKSDRSPSLSKQSGKLRMTSVDGEDERAVAHDVASVPEARVSKEESTHAIPIASLRSAKELDHPFGEARVAGGPPASEVVGQTVEEDLAQTGPTIVKPLLDRSRREIEKRGELVQRLTAHVMKHQNASLLPRETPEGRYQAVAHLVSLQLVGRRGRARELVGQLFQGQLAWGLPPRSPVAMFEHDSAKPAGKGEGLLEIA